MPAVQAGTAVEAEAAVQRCTFALVLAAALPAPRLLHLRPSRRELLRTASDF